jgi:hypothetical protein
VKQGAKRHFAKETRASAFNANDACAGPGLREGRRLLKPGA